MNGWLRIRRSFKDSRIREIRTSLVSWRNFQNAKTSKTYDAFQYIFSLVIKLCYEVIIPWAIAANIISGVYDCLRSLSGPVFDTLILLEFWLRIMNSGNDSRSCSHCVIESVFMANVIYDKARRLFWSLFCQLYTVLKGTLGACATYGFLIRCHAQ